MDNYNLNSTNNLNNQVIKKIINYTYNDNMKSIEINVNKTIGDCIDLY